MNYRENKLAYEDLVQFHQDGKISWLEFIEAQESLLIDYREWLLGSELEKDDDSAQAFLDYKDNMVMNCQIIN